MAVTESLAGRRILITGAGSGIGAVTARLLIDQGARVAIIDRDGGAVRRTAESFEPGTCLGFEGDVVDGAAIERALGAMQETWGGIDDLINNVGTMTRFSISRSSAGGACSM
jgi:NADP-dependent 3-hydroxy acid dehydrogenase YdfG